MEQNHFKIYKPQRSKDFRYAFVTKKGRRVVRSTKSFPRASDARKEIKRLSAMVGSNSPPTILMGE